MKIDPEFKAAIKLLKEIFEDKNIDFCVIGALVPYLEIAIKFGVQSRGTIDIDCVIGAQSWNEYDKLLNVLEKAGFAKTKKPHRLTFGSHTYLDLIPYSKNIVKNGVLTWPRSQNVMHVGIFEKIFEDSEEQEIDKITRVKVASIPIFVLSKVMAYEDRRLNKDIADITFCLKHYESDPKTDSRFNAMNTCEGLIWEYAGAYVLGQRSKKYVNKDIEGILNNFLNKFVSFEVPVIDMILHEEGRFELNDEMRKNVFNLFVWLRKGLDKKTQC